MNKKVTILVACHKPDTVYKNDISRIIIGNHVGISSACIWAKDEIKIGNLHTHTCWSSDFKME